MNSDVKLKRNVYLILFGILLLAAVIQLSHFSFILQFSKNYLLSDVSDTWKPRMADPASLQPAGDPYCIAFDSGSTTSSATKQQAEKVLQYMKKPVRAVDLMAAPFVTESCSSVIVTTNLLGQLGNPDALSEYVKRGGYALLARTPELDDTFYRLYRKLGIVRASASVEATGIELIENVLLSQKGLRITSEFFTNSSIQVELDSRSKVLAKTGNGIPLLWEFPYGEGKFMVFNGTMLDEKIHRGIFAGALSLLEPEFIYPVFNSKLVYIDDFPAPVAKVTDPELFNVYRRDRPSFHKDIWWPDMLQLAKRYDVKYSAMLIESYNNRVTPPFEGPEDAEVKGLITYGREVIKSGGEIGLHGYNHQSLQSNPETADFFEYRPWQSISHMADAVAEAIRYTSKAFPNYKMISYVPPSNVLSPEGREALKSAWPDMAIISSIYPEDGTGRAYVQEFEIAEDGILEMPRITSGYMDQPYERWVEASVMTTHGYLSHFVHPDDLFSDDRSFDGLTWDKMREQFAGMLARQERQYPWIRPMTSIEAGRDMERFLNSRVDLTRSHNRINGSIKPFQGPMYFILRTGRSLKDLSHCEAKKIDEGVYLITARQADFEIKLGE